MDSAQFPHETPASLPVWEMLLECTFDRDVVGFVSGDNDHWDVQDIMKTSAVYDVESGKGRS